MSRYSNICSSLTLKKKRCKNKKIKNTEYCCVHSTKEEDICSICCELPKCNNKIKLDICEHIFCTKCINEWFLIKESCPYCRSGISIRNKTVYIQSAILSGKIINVYFKTYNINHLPQEEKDLFIEYNLLYFSHNKLYSEEQWSNILIYIKSELMINNIFNSLTLSVKSTYQKLENINNHIKYIYNTTEMVNYFIYENIVIENNMCLYSITSN